MRSFNWILPGLLAGSGRPGLLEDLEVDLDWIASVGIRHLFTLTKKPLDIPSHYAIEAHHFPIPDMGIPTPRAALEICHMVTSALAEEQPVLFHCRAGIGRTGTMLASTLVSLGATPDAAIARVRGISRYYIQSESQEDFVGHYYEFLRDCDRENALPTGFRLAGSNPPGPDQGDRSQGEVLLR